MSLFNLFKKDNCMSEKDYDDSIKFLNEFSKRGMREQLLVINKLKLEKERRFPHVKKTNYKI